MMGRLLLYAYVFYVIYAPPLPFGGGLLRTIVLIIVPVLVFFGGALSKRPYMAGFRLLRKPVIAAFLIATLFGALYVAILVTSTAVVSDLQSTRLVQNLLPALVVVNAAVIVGLLKATGHSRWRAFEVLLWMGSFQGIFSIAGALAEPIHDISRSLYAASGGMNEFVASDRIYGLSTDFTYGTAIYHGILAAVAIWYMVSERKRCYVVPALLIIATSALNARTGVLVFVGMVSICLVLHYMARLNVIRLTAVILVGWGILYLVTELLRDFVPAVYATYEAFIQDTRNLIYLDQYTGNYSVLVPEIQRVPQGLGLIFGEGRRLYDLGAGERTDIGFTNDLFLGGLMYVVPVYFCFIVFLMSKVSSSRVLGVALVFAAVVSSMKGEMFHNASILFAFALVKLIELQFLDSTDASHHAEGDRGETISGPSLPGPRAPFERGRSGTWLRERRES
ncbi:hypothetical protein [Microbacterium esteraromaticum]|uniref:hypothetical protein n=1 Tax=Microbacterium esteraromaticum TaxID=57043 RepID=UPI001C97C98C|nr:hypothetical protein [Microbacterium esteraromaticum]MBY6060315.1 hypothetical protein [Microbacterium esteraromaticum]